jgi:hypothetical protein
VVRERHEEIVRRDRVVSERREANAVLVPKANVHHGPRGSAQLVHRESERHAGSVLRRDRVEKDLRVHHGPRGSAQLVHRESERHAAAEAEVLNRLNSRRKLQ